jgi:hypothetical protein
MVFQLTFIHYLIKYTIISTEIFRDRLFLHSQANKEEEGFPVVSLI